MTGGPTSVQGAVAPSPTSPPAQPTGDLTGRVLGGRYRLNRPIASGGMAQVWEGTDEVLARRVAVKILHQHLARDESFVRRFRAEAIAAGRLTHPSIVSIYDTITEGDVNAIVMELVSGTTLRADLDRHGPLQLAAVLAIGTQVADALGAAHAAGLVHRDVKPANILLSADGRVLVADFGIAKAADAGDLTSDGSMVGTAKYLAPEQVEGRPLDGRADIYALGVVLYEALTGTPPFQADSDLSTALARLHRDPVRPRQIRPDIPPSVEAVVGKALARRPEDRFASAGAMRSALLAAGADPAQAAGAAQAAVAAQATASRGGGFVSAPPVAQPPAPPAPAVPVTPPHEAAASTLGGADDRRPRSRSILVILLAVVLAGAGLAWALGRSGRSAATNEPISAFHTFDPPPGSGGENDAQLVNLTDGNPNTGWQTERYKNPDITSIKPGVGLVAVLSGQAGLDQLVINSPSSGWSAKIFVSRGQPADLTGWGEPVNQIVEAQAGLTRVDLHGRSGDSVMIWFTNVGPSRFVQVDKVEVTRR